MGLVFDIKHYAIHDGPGIRITVFLKGCPLNCPWCHNPESKKHEPEFMWTSDRCIGCGTCIESCPNGAISLKGRVNIDESLCDLCGICVSKCYSNALELIGRQMTVDEVISEIEKDRIFFEESKGGVTFSGGEPLSQPEFLHDLLVACKERGYHTAVDTCGYAKSEDVKRIKNYVDIFLYDLKHMDRNTHKERIGVPNDFILENLRILKDKNVIIRVPLIPGFNDAEENLRQMCEFLSDEGFKELSILPFHKAGTEKTERLNDKKVTNFVVVPPTGEEIGMVKSLFEKFGLKVKVGG